MPATIFSGTKVKTLKDTLSLNGLADVISSTTDPTASAVSASVGSLLLNTTNGKLYRKLDAGSSTNWEEVGSGSSGINYISNSQFESNITGWVGYDDGAVAAPVNGTGGAPTVLTAAHTTSEPLRGIGSLLISHTAADGQGEGISTDFTIDAADSGQVLSIQLDAMLKSGTYDNGATSVDPSDLSIFIYDVTNADLITPTIYKLELNAEDVPSKFATTFQSASDSTSYRLIVHNALANTDVFTVSLDNVIVGPITYYQGQFTNPTIQKFTSGSGTYIKPSGVKYLIVEMVGGGGGGGGSGTATGGTGGTGGTTSFGTSLLSCVGGTGGAGANGSPGGAGGTASLGTGPIGIALTGGRGSGTSTNGGTAGIFNQGAHGADSVFGGGAKWQIGNTVGGAAAVNTGGGGQGGGTSSAINFWNGAGGGAGGYVKAIIHNPDATYSYAVGAGGSGGTPGTSGFSGGAGGSGLIIVEEYYDNAIIDLSSVTDTETVVAKVYRSATQSLGHNAFAKVEFDTVVDDTHSMYDTANDRMIIQAQTDGHYHFHGWIAFAANSTGVRAIQYKLNGTLVADLVLTNASTFSMRIPFTFQHNLVAGDYIEIWAFQNSGGDLNIIGNGSPDSSTLSVYRIK